LYEPALTAYEYNIREADQTSFAEKFTTKTTKAATKTVRIASAEQNEPMHRTSDFTVMFYSSVSARGDGRLEGVRRTENSGG
jgi:hypothetical protein